MKDAGFYEHSLWECMVSERGIDWMPTLVTDTIEEIISAALSEGFKAGQETMRERAAKEAEQEEEYGHGVAIEIRSLPIEEPPAI